MGTFGGLAPFPRRFGGAPRRVETILKSLQQQLAPKYDVANTNGPVYVRLNALARVIAGAWSQNARLANQWDPSRMTDFLERWEKILGLTPSPTDSMTLRRARVGARMALAGFGTFAAVYTLCQMLLGPCFVSLVHTSPTQAAVWTPAGWPMGNHATNPGEPQWSSSVDHLVILVQKPSAMDESEFYTTVSSVLPELDDILPAWATFDWVRDGAHGAGFYLDEDHNLDNQRFD